MTNAQKRIERAKELDMNATHEPWHVDEDCVLDQWDQAVAETYFPGDTEFIAESRTLLPALAADLEKALAEIERLRKNRDALAHGEKQALAMMGQAQEKLAQAERDKAAMREGIANLTRYDSHTAHSMISKDGGGFLHRGDVLALFDKPLQGEGSAVAVPSEKAPAPWIAELDRLAAAIETGGEAAAAVDRGLYTKLVSLYGLRCVALHGQGEAEAPRAVLEEYKKGWPESRKAIDFSQRWTCVRDDGGFAPEARINRLRVQSATDTFWTFCETMLENIDRAGAEILAAHRDIKPENVPSPNRFDCPACGQGVTVDQDGCCAGCGASAAVFVDGRMVQDFDGNRPKPEKPEGA